MAPTQLRDVETDSSYAVFPEGLVVKSLEDIDQRSIDPRISLSSRPDATELDTRMVRQLSNFVQHKEPHSDSEKSPPIDEVLYVDFDEGDIRNPVCFPRSKKWGITLLACFSTLIASFASSAYNLGIPSMTRDLNCTEFQATVGFIVYPLGFGIVPLVTSSLSEEFGRQPLYIGSAIGFTTMYLLIALAKNIQTVIVARFLQGSFGSTWATMVGGTIADIWTPHERGLPMAIFSVAALGGTGLGPVISGWIEMNPRLEWRWIEWIQMMRPLTLHRICAAYSIVVPMIMRETRSSILLTRLANKIRKETGDHRYRARIEDERASLSTLIFLSCTRPIQLLFTEPVVMAFSASFLPRSLILFLWIGFLWGVLFCLIRSIPGVFQDLHHFNIGQEGSVFASLVVGTALGFASNFYQEHLYHKHFDRRGPEARLIMACGAAIMLPISMFIYAWCSFPRVTWIALVIALAMFTWAIFIVYLSVFSYLADCYGAFASSALAGQSLCRNMLATVFPLFTAQMFSALGYKWANTMFALIASVMAPIPFVLFFYGPTIRARSKFSRAVVQQHK
ncbi:MFS polyamine transporter [Mycena alexandri]|uniref:MFS polyamine transporter n=1 Tax=Mycena alexandri TaxID=1745969 RepID=A0AAD6SZ67_9AGAR|nr:MFS polyamine transporter [Mycena alexandri]